MALTVSVLGGPVQLTGVPVRIDVSGCTVPAGASDYKTLLKVISLDGKLEKAPFEDGIPPDGTGVAKFDISGWVDQPVDAIFEYPQTGNIISYPTQAFNVQVQAGESYIDSDGNLQEEYTVLSEVFQLLKGGTTNRQLQLWKDANTSFYKIYIEGKKFLTLRPQGDLVHKDQPVKLWFLPVADAVDQLKIKAYYFDGNSNEVLKDVYLVKDNLYEINCNPFNHDIPMTSNGSFVDRFEVSLIGEINSDVRVFYFDWHPCRRPIFLFFANSIGGVDDVYLSGKFRDNFDIESEVVRFPYKEENNARHSTLRTSSKVAQNTWTANTGVKYPTQMLHLRDLLVSRQAWLLYPNLTISKRFLIPVNVMNSKQLLVDWDKDLHSMELLLAEGHKSPFSFDNRIQ